MTAWERGNLEDPQSQTLCKYRGEHRDAQFPGSEEAANAEGLGKGPGFLKIGYFP